MKLLPVNNPTCICNIKDYWQNPDTMLPKQQDLHAVAKIVARVLRKSN